MKQNPISILKRVERFRTYNISRKVKAIKFNEEKAAFLFKIIPFLLHCNAPDLPGFVDDPECPWGIHRFSPKGIITKALFLKYFPQSTALQKDTPSPFTKSPCIHSLKTIGSIGTIAQTLKSDCDYWVSIKNSEFGPNGKELLQQKCKFIENWAGNIGYEVYFFLMDIDQTRDNSFDSKAEEESAGTALKLLLKDELFRTHIQVAGKMLLWWLIPPGLSELQYKEYILEISKEGEVELNNFVDLGYISDIPKAEIFGACLWQMNKALESPFKSVIKFAYLELLMHAADTKVRLFSDQIKLLVTYPEKTSSKRFRSLKLTDVDPYLLLSQAIVAFYGSAQTKNKRDEFIKVCLFLKIIEGMAYQDKKNEKASHLIATSEVMEGWNLLPQNVDHCLNFRDWKVRDLIVLGTQVHDYLTDTYKTFRSLFKKFSSNTGLTISEHDLSVLGRKLFTFHEKKEHKIDFIKGLSRETMLQREITLHVSRFEGKDYFLAFQGAYDTVSIQEKSDYIIKRETHLIRLIVWLTINGILTKKCRLLLTKNYLPFDLADIESLRDQIFDSFPNVHFSHISSDQLLQNEIIVKALAVINFPKATVKGSKTLQTTIISTNSYGEFFIQDYSTLTQYKNALTGLLTKHLVSRWNDNLQIYIPEQPEKHLLQNMLSS